VRAEAKTTAQNVQNTAEQASDVVEVAVGQAEERAEDLREKLEDAMRETRLAATPPPEDASPTLVVDTSIAPPIEDVIAGAHSLADQLRERAAAANRQDLALIDGIGERTAEALYKGGINTFAQLAALSEDEIRQILEANGVQARGTLASWREQAARFAEDK